ncbi:hypothetical protein KL771_15885 [Hyphomicrobiaceae bacterium 22]|uniref:RHS repeat protein n=1 Tax=Prosthecodimorpha staleyi TaxID=2840188 RepID=A0A947D9W6_9HYPH|nr:hypothetical protein [Prosthecodimorpha staleyi]
MSLFPVFPDGDAVGTPAAPVTYDAAGRLLSIPGHVASFTYDAAGRTLRATYANGVTTDFTYSTARGWLDRVLTANGATVIEDKTYTRDPGGRITQARSTTAKEDWNYGYDTLGQAIMPATPNRKAAAGSISAGDGRCLSSSRSAAVPIRILAATGCQT